MTDTIEDKFYSINLAWFDDNKVSFSEVAGRRLCHSCQKKLTPAAKESPEELIKVITQCCAREKDYLHSQQPVMESVFRLFLSSSNRPLAAETILRKINEKRPDNPLTISVETVQKLLDSGRFFGLGPSGAKT